jgi:spermidine synthase
MIEPSSPPFKIHVSSPNPFANSKGNRPFSSLSILLALLLMGFTFTITQVVVIRELLVIFMGNELSIAIILANWLLLEAAGSFFLGKRMTEAASEKKYAFLQILLSLFLPATIYGIRALRDIMGLSVGEGASLLQILLWTLIILSPLGIIDGILFALGCALHAHFFHKPALSLGKVYLYEGLGAGIGGVLYTLLLLPFLNPFEIALLLGIANLASGILLLSSRSGKGRTKTFLILWLWTFLIAEIFFLILPGARVLEKSSLNRQWKGVQILESSWSPYGNVAVGRREDQLTFFSNGIPTCTVPIPNIAFAEEMVHYPLLSLPTPESVLIIGGGPGGVIAEVLKHPVAEVHYTEIDPLMIQIIQQYPSPLSREELQNPRVRVHTVDGRLYLKMTPRKFNAILLNLPVPSTLELSRFYTVDFFSEVSRSLKNDGILALHLPGSDTYLSRETRDLNLCLKRSLQAVFPSVQVIPGEVNYFLAFASPGVGPLSPGRLIERLRERKISTHFFREPSIRLKLDPHRQQWLEDSLSRGGGVRLNRDGYPSGLYYAIAYWNAQFHPALQVLWGKMENLRLWHLGLAFLIMLCVTLLFGRRRQKGCSKGALIWVVSSTGFFGMATSVLLIFAFQTLYGYAYHWIGLLIAFFMAGLASGSWSMNRNLEGIRKTGLALAWVEILILILAALEMILLSLLYSPGLGQGILSAVRYGFILTSAIAGYLVGLEFPLAGGLFSRRQEGVVRTAGILYAADLFGAFIGSILVGVIMVPVLGIVPTCTAIIFLKTSSLALTFLSGLAAEKGKG